MMEVDGSIGEGGGQVLRTSVALSALTQKPIMVKNIRAKRDKSGLRNQHMTAIKAVAAIVDADVDGLELGSSEITFTPKHWRGGEFKFDIGTAGSTTLVLQALLPVLAFSKRHSNVTLIGGTNNPMAPQIDYFIHVLNPILAKMGFSYELTLVRRGFYPRGGGLIIISVEPISSIEPINIVELGSLESIKGLSLSAKLPEHVAYRQAVAAKEHLASAGYSDVAIDIEVRRESEVSSAGSGIVLWAETSTGGIIGGDALGERGKPAEKVGRDAAIDLVGQLRTGAPIDRHLGDQLIIWMAMAVGPSAIMPTEITPHALTSMMIVEQLTGRKFMVTGHEGARGVIQCSGGVKLR
ncbi:MAG TPA: RNA 3'-terminal phosphate cyclase [Candidatus Acidoferrum sp.]|nr:RNA 3'-terminal phosphate cyclase [Candidatus Acidoferrum sp.]